MLIMNKAIMGDLAKHQSFEEIAKRAAAIYEKVKTQYEPALNGKFLAIEVESGNGYLGNTSGEALEEARAKHPEKLFYLVRVGFDSVATLAHSLMHHL